MLNKVLLLAIGATVGSLITYKVVKNKYEEIIDDILKEQDCGKEIKNAEQEIKKEDLMSDDNEEVITTMESYKEKIKELRYASEEYRKQEKEEEKEMLEPYVISPEEFGEMDGYETVSLTLYSDGILADDDGYVIEDVEGMVGLDYESHFGEYEDDSVFIRNDERQTDYEILLDEGKYRERNK